MASAEGASIANEPRSNSLFHGALLVLPKLKEEVDGKLVLLTEPFLEGCREVLPVLDVFGTAFSFVRADVAGNINRIAGALEKEPVKFRELYNIVRVEKEAGTAEGKYSDTQAVLWLTRAMDFLLDLLKKLEVDKDCTVYDAASASYSKNLGPYHGWIAKSAFQVAMQFCPTREQFYAKLGSGYFPEDLMHLLEQFEPVLQENHDFLDSMGYDKLVAI